MAAIPKKPCTTVAMLLKNHKNTVWKSPEVNTSSASFRSHVGTDLTGPYQPHLGHISKHSPEAPFGLFTLTKPDPDLWTDFVAQPQTCLINTNEPDDLNSWLMLAAADLSHTPSWGTMGLGAACNAWGQKAVWVSEWVCDN